MNATAPISDEAAAGATYRFTVRNAGEAVEVIRRRFGGRARVLSVRETRSAGLSGLLGRTRLEIVARQEPAEPPPPPPMPGPSEADSILAPNAAPRPGRLPDLLDRAGFDPRVLGGLGADPEFAAAAELPLHRGLVELGRQLRRRVPRLEDHPLPARVAFLGAAGSGRTTALCKWVGREVFQRGRHGFVVRAEIDQPHLGGGLSVYCDALGLPLEHARPGWRCPDPGAGFAAIDCPPLAVRGGGNEALRRFLDEAGVDGRVLVLNAAYDAAILRAIAAAGRSLGAAHVAFTHLDETERWGRLWEFVLEEGLCPLFFASGPSLTGGLTDGVADALVRQTLPGA